MTTELIPSFLRALSTSLTSLKFAAWAYKLADIAALGALLIELGADGEPPLAGLTAQLHALVQSEAAPSADEWAQLDAVHAQARQLIERHLQAQFAAAAPAPIGAGG